MKKTILHLCADICSDSKPYRDSGYTVITVGKDIGVENFSAKGLTIHGVIANPPCTHLSFARRSNGWGNTGLALPLVNECLRIISECNPV